MFGATGYTGGLTAERLAADPAADGELVLAGRNKSKLKDLATELSDRFAKGRPISVEVADVSEPASVRALLNSSEDVIVSTVGPFFRWGRPAVDAAIDAGATYIDSTGEPAFLRQLFIDDAPRARETGARLLPAFGYDYVPGNLAGALALAEARRIGTPASRIEIGYFMPGGVGASSGTAATGAGIIFEPSYSYDGGKIITEHSGRHTHTFSIDGQQMEGISLGATEHFGLPHQQPQLQQVGVYMGAVGKWSKPMSYGSRALNAALKVPGVKSGLQAAAAKTVTGSQGGPDEQARSGIRSVAVAEAFSSQGVLVSRIIVDGPSPYDLTADALAWAARNSAAIKRDGTLAPTDAFGLRGFVAGCKTFGLRQV